MSTIIDDEAIPVGYDEDDDDDGYCECPGGCGQRHAKDGRRCTGAWEADVEQGSETLRVCWECKDGMEDES